MHVFYLRFVTKTGTAGSSDFVSKTVDVLFEPGAKQKTVKVDLINDKLLEPSEIFEVSLESSSVDAVKLGKPSSVRIIDDDGKHGVILFTTVTRCI